MTTIQQAIEAAAAEIAHAAGPECMASAARIASMISCRVLPAVEAVEKEREVTEFRYRGMDELRRECEVHNGQILDKMYRAEAQAKKALAKLAEARGLLHELANQSAELIRKATHFASEDLAAPVEANYLWCAIDDTECELDKVDAFLSPSTQTTDKP